MVPEHRVRASSVDVNGFTSPEYESMSIKELRHSFNEKCKKMDNLATRSSLLNFCFKIRPSEDHHRVPETPEHLMELGLELIQKVKEHDGRGSNKEDINFMVDVLYFWDDLEAGIHRNFTYTQVLQKGREEYHRKISNDRRKPDILLAILQKCHQLGDSNFPDLSEKQASDRDYLAGLLRGIFGRHVGMTKKRIPGEKKFLYELLRFYHELRPEKDHESVSISWDQQGDIAQLGEALQKEVTPKANKSVTPPVVRLSSEKEPKESGLQEAPTKSKAVPTVPRNKVSSEHNAARAISPDEATTRSKESPTFSGSRVTIKRQTKANTALNDIAAKGKGRRAPAPSKFIPKPTHEQSLHRDTPGLVEEHVARSDDPLSVDKPMPPIITQACNDGGKPKAGNIGKGGQALACFPDSRLPKASGFNKDTTAVVTVPAPTTPKSTPQTKEKTGDVDQQRRFIHMIQCPDFARLLSKNADAMGKILNLYDVEVRKEETQRQEKENLARVKGHNGTKSLAEKKQWIDERRHVEEKDREGREKPRQEQAKKKAQKPVEANTKAITKTYSTPKRGRKDDDDFEKKGLLAKKIHWNIEESAPPEDCATPAADSPSAPQDPQLEFANSTLPGQPDSMPGATWPVARQILQPTQSVPMNDSPTSKPGPKLKRKRVVEAEDSVGSIAQPPAKRHLTLQEYLIEKKKVIKGTRQAPDMIEQPGFSSQALESTLQSGLLQTLVRPSQPPSVVVSNGLLTAPAELENSAEKASTAPEPTSQSGSSAQAPARPSGSKATIPKCSIIDGKSMWDHEQIIPDHLPLEHGYTSYMDELVASWKTPKREGS